MSEDHKTSKSITEQIIDELFARLDTRTECPSEMIEALRALVETDNLNKSREIVIALKSDEEETQ